jgi:hypothetical protein
VHVTCHVCFQFHDRHVLPSDIQISLEGLQVYDSSDHNSKACAVDSNVSRDARPVPLYINCGEYPHYWDYVPPCLRLRSVMFIFMTLCFNSFSITSVMYVLILVLIDNKWIKNTWIVVVFVFKNLRLSKCVNVFITFICV